MADNANGQKKSGQLTWLWMVTSFIVVGGFMFWLAENAETSSMVAAVEEAPAEQPLADASGAVLAPADELATNAEKFQGQTVRLVDVQVASSVGSQAFWTSLPAEGNTIPFLVRLGDALVSQGVTVTGGETVTLVGDVLAMSDSVLTAWEQAGVLTDDMQKMEAEFATMFLEAVRVERAGD